ncbi:orotidine-5'-phosphate decarboxylase [Bacillaceae bacterium W0354]
MDKQIFIALDFQSGEEALNFINENHLHEVPVKVGMQLFYREGPPIIKKLKENNHPIFLDLKLHDIPNTVKQAAIQLAQLEVDLITVHAAGGSKMMAAAKEGLEIGSRNKQPLLIAVTQLTSTNEQMLNQELLINEKLDETVIKYAENSFQSGADGVVCSVHEVRKIKSTVNQSLLTVTPGIRLEGDLTNDQARVATPSVAIQEGSDFIVIGRSITQANDPIKAYQMAIKEWRND